MLLVIRADASGAIGAGHVMRCLALAQAWQDAGGSVTFVCTDINPPLTERLLNEGMRIEKLDQQPGSTQDAQQTLVVASRLNATALVVDGYQFEQDYHDIIATFEGNTLTVDDYGHLSHYRTNFVLNQNLGADAAPYINRAKHTELLLGTDYALIRREFLQHPDRGRARDGTVSKVLVTLGGSDPDNVTATVIRGLQLLEIPELNFRIIAGALNQNYDRLADLVDGDSRFELLRSVSDMASQYAWADLAIAAGGSSNWEMCCFGLPRILLVIADNQVSIAQNLEDGGIASNIQRADIGNSDAVRAAVEQAISNPSWLLEASDAAGKLIDGIGSSRCVSNLTQNFSLSDAAR